MNIQSIVIAFIGIAILVIGAWFVVVRPAAAPATSGIATSTSEAPILSFEDCAAAGYPLMESYPRKCRTADGRTYAEEIPEKATYVNATADQIVVETPFPGAVTGKEFTVTGRARGTWYFEASFPIALVNAEGKTIATGIAQAQGDWMTEDFVSFKADMKVPATYMGKATLVMKKDNPSGMPERDASLSFPITVEY